MMSLRNEIQSINCVGMEILHISLRLEDVVFGPHLSLECLSIELSFDTSAFT